MPFPARKPMRILCQPLFGTRKADGFKLTFNPEPPYYVTSHFSMTRDDIDYGLRVIRALGDLSDPKTFRLLSRERGLTFSGIVDAWIARHEPGDDTPLRLRVQSFVSDLCAEHQIPDTFYQGMASLEFSDAQAGQAER